MRCCFIYLNCQINSFIPYLKFLKVIHFVTDLVISLLISDISYLNQFLKLAADHLVHAVDLARALGIDDTVDAAAAAAIEDWFGPREAMYRSAGVIGPRVEVSAGAGPAARLLGMMGRRP